MSSIIKLKNSEETTYEIRPVKAKEIFNLTVDEL